MAQRRAVTPGTLFLDSEGLSKAAVGDPEVRAHLVAAQRRGARVATSALCLTETIRGRAEDAAVHRVLARIGVAPADRSVCAEAGALLGARTLRNVATVDAVVAATAGRQVGPVVVLTSDPVDLGALTEDLAAVHRVVHV